jgi:hypothetical protein
MSEARRGGMSEARNVRSAFTKRLRFSVSSVSKIIAKILGINSMKNITIQKHAGNLVERFVLLVRVAKLQQV